MAISIYCSLNLSPAPPSIPSSSPIPKTAQLSCSAIPTEQSWKSRCLLGLTCAVIGIGIGIGDFTIEEKAIAMDMQSAIISVPSSRWSDRRACQPWRLNSLETIVPENLPRPSARRRWEATGFSQAAPPVKVVGKSGAKGCFLL